MSYAELVMNGKDYIHEYFPWLILGLAVIIVIYIFLHKKVMGSNTEKSMKKT